MERKKICVLSGAIILSMLVLALLSSPVVIGKSEKTQILRSPPYGGVYKIGMLSDVKNLNPCVANDVYSWYLLDLVYDSLSRPDETQMPVPWVAESWWETTPDHMNLTVRVRQGLSWHDGQPLTADDVVFTYNFLMDVGRYAMALEAIDWTPLPGAIDRNETYYVGVQKVDTYNVSFKLWRPDAAFFLDALGVPLLPKHIWRNHWEDKTTWNMDYNPSTGTANVIGSGPFKFKYWYQGVKASVERNPSYFWQIRLEDGNIYTAPFLDEIQFLLYGNIENALDALKAGNIDYIPQPLDPSRIPFLAQIPGVKLFVNDDPGYFYLMFNMMLPYQGYDEGTGYQPRGFETDPITYPDPQAGEDAGLPFRKAVAHCIDKEFIVSHLLQGFGVKGDSIVPPFYSFWYNDTLPQYDYNITTAVSILEAANYRDVNGDGWREDYAGRVMDGPNSNGQIDILTLDYDPVRARAGEMIAEALKAAGVKAEAVTTSLGLIVDSVFVYREFEMFILGWRLGLDPIWVYDFFNSKFDWYNSSIGDGGNNVAGYRNQHYDNISAKVMEEMDLATRVALVKECQGMIATHLPTNVLYYKKLIEVADNTEWSGYMEQIGGVGNFWTFLQLHQPVLVPELRVDVKASQPVLEGNAYANLRLTVTALRQDSTPYPNVTVSLALSPSDPEIFLPAQSMLTDANGKAEFLVVVKNNYLAGRIYRAVVSATDGSNNATAETYFEILPAGFVVDVESPRVVVGTANTIFYLNATVTQSGTPVQGAQVEIQALYPSTNLQIVNTRGNTDENGRVSLQLKVTSSFTSSTPVNLTFTVWPLNCPKFLYTHTFVVMAYTGTQVTVSVETIEPIEGVAGTTKGVNVTVMSGSTPVAGARVYGYILQPQRGVSILGSNPHWTDGNGRAAFTLKIDTDFSAKATFNFICIVASGGYAGFANTSVEVTAKGITISHTPVSYAVVGSPIYLSANLTSIIDIVWVKVYYTPVGSNTSLAISMNLVSGTETNGTWAVEIPAQSEGGTLTYYIVAMDAANQTASTPEYAVVIGTTPETGNGGLIALLSLLMLCCLWVRKKSRT